MVVLHRAFEVHCGGITRCKCVDNNAAMNSKADAQLHKN